MSYCSVSDNKEHLLKLIEWLYKEVQSAGGDGDALWYSKFYSVEDLLPLIKEYNETLPYKWEIHYDKTSITWNLGQEGIYITNDESDYQKTLSWQQCIIVY